LSIWLWLVGVVVVQAEVVEVVPVDLGLVQV
jgi:hypothetical protein